MHRGAQPVAIREELFVEDCRVFDRPVKQNHLCSLDLPPEEGTPRKRLATAQEAARICGASFEQEELEKTV